MIPYVGCDAAREMLDAFADDELAVADQVLVESHLRWCRTCSARLEDLRLIGNALRSGSYTASSTREQQREVSTIQQGVLTRIGAEHAQSFGVWVSELFADWRLLWPAVGATAAVILCVSVAFGVLQAASEERPESLAAMIGSLSNPGSDHNPLRLDNVVSIPRVLDNGISLDGLGDGEAVFAFATVVTREGRISNYELLDSVEEGAARSDSSRNDLMVELHDAMKQSRFAPAQAPGGRVVAVNMVWLIAHTTVRASLQPLDFEIRSVRPPRHVPAAIKPSAEAVEEPAQRRSGSALDSTTA